MKVVDFCGSVEKEELKPGINFFVNPLASKVDFDVRTQQWKEAMGVPTKEGLVTTLDISILYHINPDQADEVYQSVSTEYQDVLIIPMLRNVARDIIASHSCEDLYNQNRQVIAEKIMRKLTKQYSERGIILEDVLLRDINLPKEVTSAVEKKISAKQEAEQMEYVLQKELKEAERKRVEAQGIADAQKIIAQSLSPEYLQWRYITTMEKLAGSDNTTFVITPYDQQLVPMLQLDAEKNK